MFPATAMSTSRHATHPSLHVRNAHDAHVVFEAVRLGILPMIRRRLAPSERDLLKSGEVFVWEEAEQKGSLERWTDGRRWSQSRMREPFLFYEEKVQTTPEEKEAKAARRAQQRTTDPMTGLPITISVPNPVRRQDRPNKPGGLTKQTYSAFVLLPGSATYRKWHLVAYFSSSDYTRLPVIEHYPELRQLRVPDGVYVSGKSLPSTITRGYASEDDDYSTYSRSPEPMSPHPVDPRLARARPAMPRTISGMSSGGYSDTEEARPMPSASAFYPSRPAPSLGGQYLQSSQQYSQTLSATPRDLLPTRPEYARHASTPSFAAHAQAPSPHAGAPAYAARPVAPTGSRNTIPPIDPSQQSSYALRSAEDRRVLDAFRLGL